MKKISHMSFLILALYFQEHSCLGSEPQGSYNYELKQGRKVVYRGQTNDLERREAEHSREGKKFTHMKKVGNAKTLSGARKAERESLETYRKNHNGKNPKYNKTNHG